MRQRVDGLILPSTLSIQRVPCSSLTAGKRRNKFARIAFGIVEGSDWRIYVSKCFQLRCAKERGSIPAATTPSVPSSMSEDFECPLPVFIDTAERAGPSTWEFPLRMFGATLTEERTSAIVLALSVPLNSCRFYL